MRLPLAGVVFIGFTMRYFDTHCHLAMDRFDDDVDQVITACRAAGVGMLAVGADVQSSRRSLELAKRHDGVYAAIGVHPCDADELDEEKWLRLASLARDKKVVAVGETGLDYYWKNVPPKVQQQWFERHIDLSLELGKPLSIHARDSVPEMLASIEPRFRDGLRAIWHCFTASKKEIGGALDFAVRHGLYLAIGGLVTFEDQKTLREYSKRIPDELLLLETDAPFLIPRPKATDRNDPRGVIRVAEVLAELRQSTPEAVADRTTGNATALFGLTDKQGSA